MTPPVLEVVDVVKHFGAVRAVDGVSLAVGPGEVVGLVGESGSGKTTLGRCVTRLVAVTSGDVRINGTDIARLPRRLLRPVRRYFNIVFQDPANPGRFLAPVNLSTGHITTAVAIGDLNGDGKPDVVAANFDTNGNNGRVSVFLQDPARTS